MDVNEVVYAARSLQIALIELDQHIDQVESEIRYLKSVVARYHPRDHDLDWQIGHSQRDDNPEVYRFSLNGDSELIPLFRSFRKLLPRFAPIEKLCVDADLHRRQLPGLNIDHRKGEFKLQLKKELERAASLRAVSRMVNEDRERDALAELAKLDDWDENTESWNRPIFDELITDLEKVIIPELEDEVGVSLGEALGHAGNEQSKDLVTVGDVLVKVNTKYPWVQRKTIGNNLIPCPESGKGAHGAKLYSKPQVAELLGPIYDKVDWSDWETKDPE